MILKNNIYKVITDYVTEEIKNLNEDDDNFFLNKKNKKIKTKIPFEKIKLDIKY